MKTTLSFPSCHIFSFLSLSLPLLCSLTYTHTLSCSCVLFLFAQLSQFRCSATICSKFATSQTLASFGSIHRCKVRWYNGRLKRDTPEKPSIKRIQTISHLSVHNHLLTHTGSFSTIFHFWLIRYLAVFWHVHEMNFGRLARQMDNITCIICTTFCTPFFPHTHALTRTHSTHTCNTYWIKHVELISSYITSIW